MEVAVLVGPLPIEALRRLAKMNRQHTMASSRRLRDNLINLRLIRVHMRDRGMQERAQLRVHLARVL